LIISGDVRHRSIRISTLSASDGFAKAAGMAECGGSNPKGFINDFP